MRVLVTGAAGFIASNLVDRLLLRGDRVTGIDNFDPYYDRGQKERNIAKARANPEYSFHEIDVRDKRALAEAMLRCHAEAVVHLAAKAGVTPSVRDPASYVEVNELGGLTVLDVCREKANLPLVYASTSSVYGRQSSIPFSEDDPAISPLSPYAASKRAGELMAQTYHSLYGLPVCILRFFTVYGPRGRPDMALFRFSRALLSGEEITLRGAETERDFTYVDDIVDGILGALEWVVTKRTIGTFNLGRSEPTKVARVIELLARALGKVAEVRLGELEPGEAQRTAASVRRAQLAFGYQPRVSIEAGLERWVDWLRNSPEAPPAFYNPT